VRKSAPENEAECPTYRWHQATCAQAIGFYRGTQMEALFAAEYVGYVVIAAIMTIRRGTSSPTVRVFRRGIKRTVSEI